VDAPALHALPAPVDQPHLAEPRGRSGLEVRRDDVRNLARIRAVIVRGKPYDRTALDAITAWKAK